MSKIVWPLQRDCDAFYGNPRGNGGSIASSSWIKANLGSFKPPFKLAMGETRIKTITVHRKCRPAFEAWFNEVWRNAGCDQRVIDAWGMSVFSGSFVYRPMRGGTALSMHAYGCAMDFDAPRNGLGDKTPHFATLRKEVIEPFLALGGLWGGDWDGDGDSNDERRCDGMHFQFARLK